MYEFYQAVVPPERRERHRLKKLAPLYMWLLIFLLAAQATQYNMNLTLFDRKRAESRVPPPPPPPLPPPPKASTPKLVVKPKPRTDENGENQGGGNAVIRDQEEEEELTLVEELKRGAVTLRRVQPDFERKTVHGLSV